MTTHIWSNIESTFLQEQVLMPHITPEVYSYADVRIRTFLINNTLETIRRLLQGLGRETTTVK